MNNKIQHDTQRQKFFLLIDGRESYLSYQQRDAAIDIQHTVVATADRGKGIAKDLVLEALNYAKENQLKVIPTCSYVEDFFLKILSGKN